MGSRIYFDTSSINWLLDDPQRDLLVAKIRSHADGHISVFTVAELASTSSEERRNRLLRLAKSISSNWRPLAMPKDLLKRSLDALFKQEGNIDASIGREWEGVLAALSNPELIDEEDYKEVSQWKNQEEDWYQNMHDEGRPYIQEALANLPPKERGLFYSKPSKTLRFFAQNEEYMVNLISGMASRCGYHKIPERFVWEIMKSEEWRLFLSGMSYGFFLRSVQREGFNKKKNPGSIDTQQAIYLTGCDIFTTADWDQHRMMRWLLPLGYRKRRVLHFDRLKQAFLFKPLEGSLF
jgi:hypothetical protein